MKLSKFKYKLPPELIALHPTPNRDEARLMVLDRKTGKIEQIIWKQGKNWGRDRGVLAERAEPGIAYLGCAG